MSGKIFVIFAPSLSQTFLFFLRPWLQEYKKEMQGRAGVLKRTTNEQRLMGPKLSEGWIKIGVGVLLIKHETD
jgi:hypothetical protein